MLKLTELGKIALLHLLLSSLHGDLFRFIQTVLQIFDGLLHVLLHTLQHFCTPALPPPLQFEAGMYQPPASSFGSADW
uniref:Si:ch211-158m24.12 n=1 Tax=Amphiprion percula TaxID=161767 RepID=A0A3P8SIU9_AMPPE